MKSQTHLTLEKSLAAFMGDQSHLTLGGKRLSLALWEKKRKKKQMKQNIKKTNLKRKRKKEKEEKKKRGRGR